MTREVESKHRSMSIKMQGKRGEIISIAKQSVQNDEVVAASGLRALKGHDQAPVPGVCDVVWITSAPSHSESRVWLVCGTL